jgi:hypothetical protein
MEADNMEIQDVKEERRIHNAAKSKGKWRDLGKFVSEGFDASDTAFKQ